MKRIVFVLCTACISLGALAQPKSFQGLQGNPKIESLTSVLYNLGAHPQVTYYYDGKLHKTVSVNFARTNDFQSTPLTGDSKRDATNLKLDSLRKIQVLRQDSIYNVLRSTCLSLTDGALESYVWESHRGGVDSVRYAIAIGTYQNGDTLMTYQRQREVFYYNAPELLSFRYDSFPYNDDIRPGGGSPKGFGSFRYEYTPDSVFRPKKDIKLFNKEGYKQKLLPLLNQKGITSRQFYVYHDSTYTIDNTVDNSKKDFAYRVITVDPKILKSETWGTVYTLHSREQAYSLLAQMQAATWDFLDENPYMRFTFNRFHEFRDRRLSEFFENLDYKRIPEFYRVYLHCYGEEYNIIIVEGTGNMMIPMEWAIIKSWKNGKVTYDKQAAKAMTPLEARSRTSEFTMTETRSFEPIDE